MTTARSLLFSCMNLLIGERQVWALHGWAFLMAKTFSLILEFLCFLNFRHIIVRLTEMLVRLLWPCTQTLPGPEILQSAVSRGRNTIQVTELTLKWTQVPSWRRHLILAECLSGMITILNWSRWSLMSIKRWSAVLSMLLPRELFFKLHLPWCYFLFTETFLCSMYCGYKDWTFP